MNKKNKILVGCLALLLALSVGYALFSDTITINGTATAKGDFVLTTECISGIPQEIDTTVSGLSNFYNQNFDTNYGASEGGYEDEICIANGTTVDYYVNFLYPSALKVYTLKVTNTGTIPAKLDILNSDFKASKTGPYSIESEVADYYIGGKSIYNKLLELFSLGLPEEEVFERLSEECILQSQESMYVIIFTGWETTDTKSSTGTATYSGTMTLPFIQATE